MSVFTDIGAALDDNLNGMTGKPPIAWENVPYTPVTGTLYARATNLFGDTNQSSLGTTGEDETNGVYQVDVFSQAGKGKSEANNMADRIADQFKRGTDLTYNGLTVRVRSASRGAARTSEGWYHIPVIINYYAITQARS